MAQIIPAILSDNKEVFKKRLVGVSRFTDHIQIDIVDGQFAPFSNVYCQKCIKKFAKTNFLEAHLMIENPEEKVESYRKLGFKKLIPHYEALKNPRAYLAQKRVSIAINPETSIEKLTPFIKNLSTVLIMGVNPGKSGQKFIPQTLKKIRQLRSLSDKIEIEVDGGVNGSNIPKIIQAGADVVVCGSAIFSKGNPKENYQKLIETSGSGN